MASMESWGRRRLFLRLRTPVVGRKCHPPNIPRFEQLKPHGMKVPGVVLLAQPNNTGLRHDAPGRVFNRDLRAHGQAMSRRNLPAMLINYLRVHAFTKTISI